MNKTSILFLFAVLALTSATIIEKNEASAADTSSTTGLSGLELYLVAVGFLAVGALNLLFGLKYFKAIIFLIGFVGAATGTYAIESAQSPAPGHFTLILYCLIAGVIGGLIFYFCYHCSIFTLGFVLFGAIAGGILTYLKLSGNIIGIVAFIAAIVGGIVALKVHDIIIIVATSFSGAGYIVTAITMFVHGVAFAAHYYDTIYILLMIALAVGGIIFQFKNKDVDVKDIGRDSISSPDVYVIDVNNGNGNPYNPYTGSRF